MKGGGAMCRTLKYGFWFCVGAMLTPVVMGATILYAYAEMRKPV